MTLSNAVPAQDARRSEPVALPISPSIPEPQDKPWPGGTITLDIDASDTMRGDFRVTETIPIAPGTSKITLLYPEWLPGHHAPRGPLIGLAGLQFLADGKPVAWQRDPVEVHGFHIDLPPGTRTLVAKFIQTTPLQGSEGRIVMTPDMLNLQWETMSLYPAGHYIRRIAVKPGITLPRGWTAVGALDGLTTLGNRVSWAETDYETLVDSPIFAGANVRQWDLGNSVRLNLVADRPELLDATPEQIALHRAMVNETLALFGNRHFDHYDFLVALSNRLGSIGLEHHRSSENQHEPEAFTQWSKYEWERGLLPHEFVHSWNGKFRRPAKIWTPDFRQPMQGNLLWVYEGQTQFWGMVLAARSGLQSPAMVMGQLASNAGLFAEQPGRGWRSVEDTTLDTIIAARRPRPYASLSRGEDYYNEGALIWLEADQIIRAGTGNRKGLDDFARAFFGIRDGDRGEVTYEVADVISALNAVYPYDWAGFIKSRVAGTAQPAPLAGIERSGYRLVWKDEPNPYDKARMDDAHTLNLYHSLGITLDKDGDVTATRWGGPAFDGGIVNGVRIIAVNGLAYDADRLSQAITGTKGGNKPIELLIRRGERYSTVPVSYYGGLRWPWLERAAGGKAPSGLDLLFAPRRMAGALK